MTVDEREARKRDCEIATRLGLPVEEYRRACAESEAMNRESLEKIKRLLKRGNLAPITILNYCK